MALKTPWTSPSIRSPDFPFGRRLSKDPVTAGANNWFVRSGAVGSGDGRSWLNAFTTLAAAFTAGAAGDKFWVAHDHAETQASAMTLASPGTAASPCFVYCVNRLGSVPPASADLATTSSISATATGAITFTGGHTYYRGISFNSLSGANAGNTVLTNTTATLILDTCAIVLPATSTGTLVIGSTNTNASTKITWLNTTLQIGETGTSISLRSADFQWRNTPTAIVGATLPTTLFTAGGNVLTAMALLEAVDLSALGSGKTIVGAQSSATRFILKDCKLGASVTVAATPTLTGGAKTIITRGDSSGTNYRSELYDYTGTQTVETTIIRTGGASDGTTPISWKLVTSANSKWILPFEALPIAVWNDTTGSPVTVTVEGIWGSTNLPQTDDIWIEVEGLGSASSPQGTFASGSKADNLANAPVWATSSEVWGGSTTSFKMTAIFTPQQKGAIYIYVKAAKASTTFYIDPRVALS